MSGERERERERERELKMHEADERSVNYLRVVYLSNQHSVLNRH